MRRPPSHYDQRGRLDVKMTPMIDVIFLLLIFFICTASFQAPEEILPTRMSLPGAIPSNVKPDPELLDLDEIVVKVVWLGDGPVWEINDVQYSHLTHAEDLVDAENQGNVEDVLKVVKVVKANLPVILDVEGAVPMKYVIDVYDVCRRVGLERVQFAASAGA